MSFLRVGPVKCAGFVCPSSLFSSASSLLVSVLFRSLPLGFMYVMSSVAAFVFSTNGTGWLFVFHVALLSVVLDVVFCRFSVGLLISPHVSVFSIRCNPFGLHFLRWDSVGFRIVSDLCLIHFLLNCFSCVVSVTCYRAKFI